MNQETRNKKNQKYQANLERRGGVTKKSDYIKMMSDGIEKSEKRNPMDGKYEFVTTRNSKGNVVSRMKYTYKWTTQAKALQELYHNTKNGIEPKVTKPKELFFDVPRTKEEIKEYFAKKKTEKKKDYIYDETTDSFIMHEIDLKDRKFSNFHYKLIEGLYMNNNYIQIIKNTEAVAKHEQKIKDLMHKLIIRKATKPSFKFINKTRKHNEIPTESLKIAA